MIWIRTGGIQSA